MFLIDETRQWANHKVTWAWIHWRSWALEKQESETQVSAEWPQAWNAEHAVCGQKRRNSGVSGAGCRKPMR